ncbi:hypothetical protein C8Q80DRAFT_1264288 [Daedaleopsis nitida]|nr:hypothetical protein C8Q80DRAFT_1264288 [Daedaleopsis nitida]
MESGLWAFSALKSAVTGTPGAMVLKNFAAVRWRVLAKPKVQKLMIKIPSRQVKQA